MPARQPAARHGHRAAHAWWPWGSGSPARRSQSAAPQDGSDPANPSPSPSLQPLALISTTPISSEPPTPATSSGNGTLSLSGQPDAPGLPAPPAPLLPDNRILVEWSPTSTATQRLAALQAVGGTMLSTIHTQLMQQRGQGMVEVIQLPPGLTPERAIQAYSNRPGVAVAERDWVVGIRAVANDPYYTTSSRLWGMYSSDSPTATGPTGTTNQFGSQAEQAWAQGATGSTKVVVGVIDEGIDYRHQDLYLNIWLNPGEIPLNLRSSLRNVDGDSLITFRDLNDSSNSTLVSDVNGNGRIDAGDLLNDIRWENGVDEDGNGYKDDLIGWDFFNKDNDPYDGTGDDHGTHVAGTIGGIGANGVGVSGVNWSVQMMSLKFLGPNGGYASDAASAVNYYADMTNRHDLDSPSGTKSAEYVATSNSWGGGGYLDTLHKAIITGGSVGNLFVAAAGNNATNNDTTTNYPSNYSTRTAPNGSQPLSWEAVVAVAAINSSGALSSFSSYGATTVDLGAPGESINSTLPDGSYGSYSGTSMATPHVSGALALLAATSSSATAQDLLGALYTGTSPTASLSGKTVSGGRLNLAGSLAAMNPPGVDVSVVPIALSDQAEGSTGSKLFSFEIRLDQPATVATPIPVTYELRFIGGATANDFVLGTYPATGTVIFSDPTNPAALVQTINVEVAGDRLVEPDESFQVAITQVSSGVGIWKPSATGVIRADDARLTGKVWNDADQSGGVTGSESGRSGVTVFLDANNNAVLDGAEASTTTASDGSYGFDVATGIHQIRLQLPGQLTQTFPRVQALAIDPDSYASGAILNSVDPTVRLSTSTGANVTSTASSWVSTGSRGFGNNGSYGWAATSVTFRADFAATASEVRLDLISDDSADDGWLEAYDASNRLLARYATASLGTGQKETMLVTSPGNDIAYVLASGTSGQIVGLDNLRSLRNGTGEAVPIALSVGPELKSGLDFGVFGTTATPVANADSYSTAEDQPLILSMASGVLGNDTNPSGTPLNAALVSSPAHGAVALNPDGSFTYTPNANFNGTDAFQYTASDGSSTSAPATVTITVSAVNDAPQGSADAYTVLAGSSLNVATATGVLANDADLDGNSLTAILESGPSQGSLTLNADGSFSYTPNPTYSGPDAFSYRVSDGTAQSAPIAVTLTVMPQPGILITPSSGTVEETGGPFPFEVVLATAPTADVTINLSVSDSSEGAIDKNQLTFTPTNWNTPQTVTVSGRDDLVVDGNVAFTVVTAPAISSDLSYNALNAIDVAVVNRDNDQPITTLFNASGGDWGASGNSTSQASGPTMTGDVTMVSGGDDGGRVQTLTEGALQASASFVASGEQAVSGTVSGTVSATRLKDGSSETITEVQSSGRTKITYLAHIWTFSGVTANTLLVDAQRLGAGNESYRFEWLSDGGTTWNPVGDLTPQNHNNGSTTSFTGLNLAGNGQLRVSTLTKETNELNLDSLVIDRLELTGTASSTSALEPAYQWRFPDLDAAQSFHLVGWENDSSDDFRFEYSTDGGTSWSNLGVLTGGTAGAPSSLDLTLAAPLSAAEVLVRATDTNRSANETGQGTLSVDKLFFKAVQNDLRPSVELTLAAGPAQEGGATASFRLSRPTAAASELRVYVDVAGSAIAGTDFSHNASSDALGTYVTIPAGQSSADLVITPINDTVVEGNETVALSLRDGATYAFRPGVSRAASTNLLDDDRMLYAPTSLSLQAGTVVNGAVTLLATAYDGSQQLRESLSGGNSKTARSSLTGVYSFGPASNVRSFTTVVSGISTSTSNGSNDDNFSLEYSLDTGTSWSPLPLDAVTGNVIRQSGTYAVTFATPLSTAAGQSLQVRVKDTNQSSGETVLGTISFEQMLFSTESALAPTMSGANPLAALLV